MRARQCNRVLTCRSCRCQSQFNFKRWFRWGCVSWYKGRNVWEFFISNICYAVRKWLATGTHWLAKLRTSRFRDTCTLRSRGLDKNIVSQAVAVAIPPRRSECKTLVLTARFAPDTDHNTFFMFSIQPLVITLYRSCPLQTVTVWLWIEPLYFFSRVMFFWQVTMHWTSETMTPMCGFRAKYIQLSATLAPYH